MIAGQSGQGGQGGKAGRAGTAADGGGTGGAQSPAGGSGGAPSVQSDTVYVSGYGPDIHVLTLDTGSAQLTERSKQSGGSSPSYMAFSPDKRFAYVINEADAPNSKALAFKINADGSLAMLNSVATGGSGSPHLAVHPSGKWLAVAHYTSGEVTVIPIQQDGSLGVASAPDRGPNGNCKNAHQAVFDSSGDHLFVPCLGSNYVLQYRFASGKLQYNDPATAAVSGGPRHFAFDPGQKHAYVLSETASLITWFDYDASTGKLSNPQTINSYDKQAGSSAHIVVHPGGKWLYASNRKENSLGLFTLDADGRPSARKFETDMLAEPRDFCIDPTGAFLIVTNQGSSKPSSAQTVILYRIDAQNGELTRAQVLPNGQQPSFAGALVLP